MLATRRSLVNDRVSGAFTWDLHNIRRRTRVKFFFGGCGGMSRSILSISDLHAPFAHAAALDFLSDLKRVIKPDRVICLGDEVDFHNFGRWDRDWNAPGPCEELAAARAYLRQLAKLFPRLTIVDSNHTWRPWKKAATAGLAASMLRDRRDVLDAPATWQWVEAAIDGDVVFSHGEGFNGQRAAIDSAHAWRRNSVIGHVHAHAGIIFQTSSGGTLWGMNAGCLVDTKAAAFNYGKHSKLKPTLGTGAVLDGLPVWFALREE